MLLVSKIPIEHFLAYKEDYVECLKFNINNNNISKIIIFVELIHPELPKSSKVEYLVRRGITEQTMFDTALKLSTENRIIMTKEISIFFNDNLSKISSEKTVYKNEYYTILNRETKFNNDFKKSTDLPIVYKINSLSDKIITQIEQVVVRKKGEVVKSKLRGVSSKLDVIIISVNYNDFLLPTLIRNFEIFENITVVTSNDDKMCEMICNKFGVNLLKTNIMYDDGAKFNKGKAINLAINSLKEPGFILLIDADIIVEEKINIENLDPETLYTSDRWMCETYEDLLKWEIGQYSHKKHIKNESDRGLGFFQLFHHTKCKSYPETSDNAAFSDILFRDKFPLKQTIKNNVIHLGKSYKNWDGRLTDRFIEDTEFQKIFDTIGQNKFDINHYFDKIYCLTLDRNSKKFEEVKKQFAQFGIEVEKFSGIDGNIISDEEFEMFKTKKVTMDESSRLGLIENKYALGCLLSHTEIIKQAKLAGYKRILIFEDDVLLSKDFAKRISEIKKIDWKLLYLGASQFNWTGIKINNNHYNCNSTLGTFAWAIDHEIFDELIKLFETKRKSIDNLLSDFQSDNKKNSIVIYPNIVISDVRHSDIRNSKNMDQYSELMKWNLNNFEIKNYIEPTQEIQQLSKMKILLVPDRPGWAFDNISKSLKKYNSFSEIEYDITYIIEIHNGKKVDYEKYDYVYVFWEAERTIPDSKKVIRGCYSAFWLENKNFSQKKLAEYFANCKGGIFANEFLKKSLSQFLPSNFPMTIIEDSSDESIFYPIPNSKNEKFTAIFVGNVGRKVKNFETIQEICRETDIELIICSDIRNDKLVHYYNKADICINFSEFEGGPQTFVEAALCQVPMLIRSNNELSKIIPCFRGETKEDFIEIINELKIDRQRCQFVGEQAQKTALENFTYKKTAEKFGKFFINLHNGYFNKKDLSNNLTVFVISCGQNPNYNDCLSALEDQNVKFNIKQIKNVAPMSAAFQKMIDECNTDYYIQVDEDMILFENSIEIIYESLISSPDNISTVAYMLKDTHLDFNLYGIKGYKHNILKKYPYNTEIISCEVDQVKRLQNDGYNTMMNSKVVGYHSPKWSEELIFERYFDLMEKWKNFKYDWLGELPSKLLDIFRKDSSVINFYALMGAMTSLLSDEKIRDREKNFKITDKNFEKIKKLTGVTDFRFIKNYDKEESNILTNNPFGKDE